MPNHADAHAHFFKAGYVALLPENCRRIQPDEVTLYQGLAQQYEVQQVLAVGYEAEPWAVGNNRYLSQLAASHSWLRPLAFVPEPANLEVAALETWRRELFAGLSLYLFNPQQTASLGQVSDEVWRWLVRQRWLITVNSRGEHWVAWPPVLERYPELRLLISHLGLPPAVSTAPDAAAARQALKDVLALARFPGVHVKLSGFYALTRPGYEYPHRAAWPYVEALLAAFGSTRLLWGSDFSPSLEWLSFPQTFGLFQAMPFLNDADRERIEGGNLVALLTEMKRSEA
ncbi:MAG: amidohydrolase family protein [Anaerolineae bacterium]|nr:amidohydrolase family protein [Anaerolineae bacterium]